MVNQPISSPIMNTMLGFGWAAAGLDRCAREANSEAQGVGPGAAASNQFRNRQLHASCLSAWAD